MVPLYFELDTTCFFRKAPQLGAHADTIGGSNDLRQDVANFGLGAATMLSRTKPERPMNLLWKVANGQVFHDDLST